MRGAELGDVGADTGRSSGPFDLAPVGGNAGYVTSTASEKPSSSQIVQGLLRWAADSGRSLPWRQTRDPWAILVSEVMSQQTQIDRVVPKWHEFMARFADPQALADAALGDVLTLWVGLGYNRRAAMLHACAVVIAEEHGGRVPEDLDALLSLPGIGPYTARAVLAFAFDYDVAVVDTNVGRILARVSGRSLSARSAQETADALVPDGRGWEWNQALLDFGAGVCTKRSPSCGPCPLREHCQWRGIGDDPAAGSAGVSTPQSTFSGSDREGRGRLVRGLAATSIATDSVAGVMGWPHDSERAERVLEKLISEGLVVREGNNVRLP